MTNEWKIDRTGRSWALGSSLLLHSLVLIGLGVVSFQGNIHEPGETVVYLAMSSFGVSQNPQAEIVHDNAVVSEIARVSSVEPSSQELKIDRIEVAIRANTTVESVEIDPVLEVSDMEPPIPGEITEPESEQFATAEVDLILNSEELSIATRSQASMEIPIPDDPVNTDYRSPITDHQSSLLAFVGDPSSLGIIMDDALAGDYVRAEAVVFPEPAYPPLSRRRAEEGRVVIKVKISAEGGVRSAEIVSGSSYARLDKAALAAVGKIRFSPATRGGIPVDSERTVAYRFRLEER